MRALLGPKRCQALIPGLFRSIRLICRARMPYDGALSLLAAVLLLERGDLAALRQLAGEPGPDL